MRISVDEAGVEELASEDADELLVEIGQVIEAEETEPASVVHFHSFDPLGRQNPLPGPLPEDLGHLDVREILGGRFSEQNADCRLIHYFILPFVLAVKGNVELPDSQR